MGDQKNTQEPDLNQLRKVRREKLADLQANGKDHIGHVLTRVIKDMIPRYRTMKGYDDFHYSRLFVKRSSR